MAEEHKVDGNESYLNDVVSFYDILENKFLYMGSANLKETFVELYSIKQFSDSFSHDEKRFKLTSQDNIKLNFDSPIVLYLISLRTLTGGSDKRVISQMFISLIEYNFDSITNLKTKFTTYEEFVKFVKNPTDSEFIDKLNINIFEHLKNSYEKRLDIKSDTYKYLPIYLIFILAYFDVKPTDLIPESFIKVFNVVTGDKKITYGNNQEIEDFYENLNRIDFGKVKNSSYKFIYDGSFFFGFYERMQARMFDFVSKDSKCTRIDYYEVKNFEKKLLNDKIKNLEDLLGKDEERKRIISEKTKIGEKQEEDEGDEQQLEELNSAEDKLNTLLEPFETIIDLHQFDNVLDLLVEIIGKQFVYSYENSKVSNDNPFILKNENGESWINHYESAQSFVPVNKNKQGDYVVSQQTKKFRDSPYFKIKYGGKELYASNNARETMNNCMLLYDEIYTNQMFYYDLIGDVYWKAGTRSMDIEHIFAYELQRIFMFKYITVQDDKMRKLISHIIHIFNNNHTQIYTTSTTNRAVKDYDRHDIELARYKQILKYLIYKKFDDDEKLPESDKNLGKLYKSITKISKILNETTIITKKEAFDIFKNNYEPINYDSINLLGDIQTLQRDIINKLNYLKQQYSIEQLDEAGIITDLLNNKMKLNKNNSPNAIIKNSYEYFQQERENIDIVDSEGNKISDNDSEKLQKIHTFFYNKIYFFLGYFHKGFDADFEENKNEVDLLDKLYERKFLQNIYFLKYLIPKKRNTNQVFTELFSRIYKILLENSDSLINLLFTLVNKLGKYKSDLDAETSIKSKINSEGENTYNDMQKNNPELLPLDKKKIPWSYFYLESPKNIFDHEDVDIVSHQSDTYKSAFEIQLIPIQKEEELKELPIEKQVLLFKRDNSLATIQYDIFGDVGMVQDIISKVGGKTPISNNLDRSLKLDFDEGDPFTNKNDYENDKNDIKKNLYSKFNMNSDSLPESQPTNQQSVTIHIERILNVHAFDKFQDYFSYLYRSHYTTELFSFVEEKLLESLKLNRSKARLTNLIQFYRHPIACMNSIFNESQTEEQHQESKNKSQQNIDFFIIKSNFMSLHFSKVDKSRLEKLGKDFDIFENYEDLQDEIQEDLEYLFESEFLQECKTENNQMNDYAGILRNGKRGIIGKGEFNFYDRVDEIYDKELKQAIKLVMRMFDFKELHKFKKIIYNAYLFFKIEKEIQKSNFKYNFRYAFPNAGDYYNLLSLSREELDRIGKFFVNNVHVDDESLKQKINTYLDSSTQDLESEKVEFNNDLKLDELFFELRETVPRRKTRPTQEAPKEATQESMHVIDSEFDKLPYTPPSYLQSPIPEYQKSISVRGGLPKRKKPIILKNIIS